MEATRCLRDEHQGILRVLDCLEVALVESRDSGKIAREVYAPFTDFFRGFADKCHHCKEEDRLFPCLEKNGIPREGGPIGVMLYEHEQGRTHIRAIAEHLDAANEGDKAAIDTILEHGSDYLNMLRAHIDKEDHCLFPMADNAVHGDDLTALKEAYSEAESTAEYRDTFESCRAIADRLTERYNVPGPQPS